MAARVRTTLAPGAPAAGNVVEPGNAFIGRQSEIATVEAWIAQGERLVTLTGVPGIGKSRLAMRLGVLLAPRFVEGGAWLCALADARTETEACTAVARAIGVPLGAGDAVAQLGHALHARGRMMLVLDDADGTVECVGTIIGRWLVAAPSLTVLVTSREVLRVPEETALELQPLDLPSDDANAPGDALRLLTDRLRRHRSTAASLEDVRGLAEVAIAMDGLPLALELAAARLATLSPSVLLARLPQRLELLNQGPRGVSSRRATLRGSFDASWVLLTVEEQSVFAQCAIFRGGFTLDDAEAVLDPLGETTPMLDVLQALRDKSLLRTYAGAEATEDGRFGMFQGLRDYANERLAASGAAAKLAQRHAAYYARQARAQTARSRREGFLAIRSWVIAEQDNLYLLVERAVEALRGTDESTDVLAWIDAALAALVALEPWVLERGPIVRLLEPLETLLDHPRVNALPGEVTAAARVVRATARRRRGRMDDALTDYERAHREARALEVTDVEARALRGLGTLAYVRGDLDIARVHFDDAIARFESLGHTAEVAATCSIAGGLAQEQGRVADARRAHDRAIALCREIEDGVGEALAWSGLGSLLVSREHGTEALACFERAASLLLPRGPSTERAYALASIGFVYHSEGVLELAAASYERALATARAIGDRRFEAMYTGYLGGVRHEQDRLRDALALLTDSARMLTTLGDARYGAIFQAWRAAVAAQLGHADEAREALALIESPGRAEAERIGAMAFANVFVENARGGDRSASLHALEARNDAGAESRLFRRIAAGIHPTHDARIASPSAPPPTSIAANTPTPALAVHREGHWFEVPGRGRVSCRKRNVTRALLMRLVDERLAHPGQALGPPDLLAAAWPGEKILPAAAMNRLYVMLTKLRKLGLRELLVARDDGYLLDPSRDVAYVDEP